MLSLLRGYAISSTAIILSACSKPALQSQPPEQTRTEVQALVRSIANAYNRSDAAAAMDVYRRDDPSITSASDGELERGWQEIRASTDSIVGTEGAFKVATGTIDVTPLGPGYALAVAPMVVTVNTAAGKVQLHAVMSVVAAHDSTGWKVIHDHTSFKKPDQAPAG